MTRFSVALWRISPSQGAVNWPEWTATVWADDAYSAIVQTMHAYGRSSVAYAVARACDSSIQYCCYRVSGVARSLIFFTGRSATPRKGEVRYGFWV